MLMWLYTAYDCFWATRAEAYYFTIYSFTGKMCAHPCSRPSKLMLLNPNVFFCSQNYSSSSCFFFFFLNVLLNRKDDSEMSGIIIVTGELNLSGSQEYLKQTKTNFSSSSLSFCLHQIWKYFYPKFKTNQNTFIALSVLSKLQTQPHVKTKISRVISKIMKKQNTVFQET